MAYHEGTYEHQTERMQEIDEGLRRELEEENERRWGKDENEGEEQEEEDGDMDVRDSHSDSGPCR